MNANQYFNPPNYSPAPHMPGFPGTPPYPGGTMPALRLATVYVPWQHMGQVFSPAQALAHGTLFPELVSPYPA